MTDMFPASPPSVSAADPLPSTEEAPNEGAGDDAIRALVTRLARPHSSGGAVIERAAILAEGADFSAVMAWISAHDGAPEAVAAAPSGGLHGSRVHHSGGTASRAPLRFVLPAGALG